MACTIEVEEHPLLGIGHHLPSYGTDKEIIGHQQSTRRDPCGTLVHVMKTVINGFGSFCAKLWIAIWPFLGFLWFSFCSIMQLVCLWRAKTDNGGHNETMGTIASFANGTWWWSQCHHPYKVEKTISYSLMYSLFTFMSAILIIRWRYQINWDDLLRNKIKQTAVYDKRYLLALYVILWASALTLNHCLKCASCEQLFALRWTIRYFSHHKYEVPHYVCSFVTLSFYAIIYVPSFFCCSYVLDLTNALVSLASDTKQLAESISDNVNPDSILDKVSNRIKEKSWSRYSGIGKELEFFTKLTMFVGATIGFSFVYIYVSSQSITLMEWNNHMTQLLALAVTIMTPFFFVAAGVKKLHEAHEIFISEARKAQVENKRVTARDGAMKDYSGTWEIIIKTMKENVDSIVNTEKKLFWTALATIGVILWQLLGHLNKFIDTPNTNIEDERFALTYIASLTLLVAICTAFGLRFRLNMISRCIKSGHRQGNCKVFLRSVLVGATLLAAVYTPWLIQFNGRKCPL